jgi:peroxiredoxin
MTLTVGELAPDFTLASQHGEDVTLSSFRGDSAVVLVFFPFAFSGVCSGELAALRDHYAEFERLEAEVLTVSCDPMYANRVFADRDGFPFYVLSDFWPHGEVSRAYGTFNDSIGAPNRNSYVIDREGVVRWTTSSPLNQPRNYNEYVKALSVLS